VEMRVKQGRGYVSADKNFDEDLSIGWIPVDSTHSPVKKVNYFVENARVGQATDYEKLTLEVWTNGAVTPRDAIGLASKLMKDHLTMFINIDDDDEEAAAARRPGVALGLAVVGIGLMLVGGDLAVRGAVRVVDAIGRSDSAVGLTILALATTAELFALVLTAARHDVPEIAVAGIVGSAAYNATATLGAAALATPLAVEGVIWAAVLAALLPLVVLLFARRGQLGRAAGGALCAGYAAYAVVVLR